VALKGTLAKGLRERCIIGSNDPRRSETSPTSRSLDRRRRPPPMIEFTCHGECCIDLIQKSGGVRPSDVPGLPLSLIVPAWRRRIQNIRRRPCQKKMTTRP
jgi:hypothetical protein